MGTSNRAVTSDEFDQSPVKKKTKAKKKRGNTTKKSKAKKPAHRAKGPGKEKRETVHPHVARPPKNDRPDAPEQHVHKIVVTLQPRHFNFLCACAKKEGRTPENMIERFIRLAMAADPTKGGTIQLGPTTEEIEKLAKQDL